MSDFLNSYDYRFVDLEYDMKAAYELGSMWMYWKWSLNSIRVATERYHEPFNDKTWTALYLKIQFTLHSKQPLFRLVYATA